MACCPHCRDAEAFFDPGTARKDLRRYRRKGPLRTTRLLLDAIQGQLRGDRTLLDVGGGVGAIQHELLESGLEAAVQVDASAAYLEVSREEADLRGQTERIEYRHGDFVELAPEVSEADIVTLDRVLCCYPDMERLIDASATKARHLYGLVFPRERWGTRLFMALGNLWFRLRGSAFRAYLHPTGEMDKRVRGHGFHRTSAGRTFLWDVVIYDRKAAV